MTSEAVSHCPIARKSIGPLPSCFVCEFEVKFAAKDGSETEKTSWNDQNWKGC